MRNREKGPPGRAGGKGLAVTAAAGATRRALAVLLVLWLPAAAEAQESRPAAAPAAEAPAQAAPTETVPVPEVPKPADLTAEVIRARLTQAENDTSLDEAARKPLVDRYKEALSQLQMAADFAARAVAFDRDLKEASEKLDRLKAELDKPVADLAVEIPADQPSAALDAELVKIEADLAAKRRKVAELEAALKARAERKTALTGAIADAKRLLEDLERQLAQARSDANPSPEKLSARTLLSARRTATAAEVTALESELLSHEPVSRALAAERDLASRDAARGDAVAKPWREAVASRRSQEALAAAAEAEKARREARRKHPAIVKLAEENARLALRRTGPAGLDAKIRESTLDLEAMEKQLQRLTKDSANLQSDVKVAGGITETMGRMLRKRRLELRDVRSNRRSIRLRQEESSLAQLALAELRRTQSDLAENGDAPSDVLAGLDPAMPADERDKIAEAARQLLADRGKYLADLISDYDKYTANLTQLNVKEQELVIKADAFAAYIDENILWVRSNPPIWLANFADAWAALGWLAAPANWAAIGRALAADVRAAPWWYVLFLVAAGSILVGGGRIRRRLAALGEGQVAGRGYRFADTVHAMLLTLVLSLPLPLALSAVGWRLAGQAEAPAGVAAQAAAPASVAAQAGVPPFVAAFATALLALAAPALGLEFLRRMSMRRGLAQRHFRWRADGLAILRRHVPWVLAVGLPLALVLGLVEAETSPYGLGPLGRLAFFALLGVLAVAAHCFTSPAGGLPAAAGAFQKEGGPHRVRHVVHVAAVGLPVALAVLAAVGYYYASLQLGYRLMGSLYLLLGLVLAYGLVLRVLFLGRVRLAIERARKRREAQPAAEDEPREAPPEPEVSLADLSDQGRHLLRGVVVLVLVAGLWLIWSDMLPALRFLEQHELWSYGAGETRTEVTASALLLALLVLAVTIVAAKNVPGLLEIVALQHLPLDSGGRFAVSTIFRYVITVVGLVVSLGLVGIGWSKVQWLAAAITVGLGFGLQEIFANFVSGLIILLERPLRVGDVVTVGETTGVVTRIRIRATTITDWDRKELVVPNKEFVTGRLVNWTLSDTILRLVIPVGIAYGSDTDLAKKRLLEVAAANPDVLDDPPPSVFFNAFGDSSLDFRLMAYIGAPSRFPVIRDQLLMDIDKAFRESGIEIAFPQRDIHIRTGRDRGVLLRKAPDVPQSGS